MGAWANVTFDTPEEALQAYEYLKNTRAKFRDVPVYANLKNLTDKRTVVFSPIRKSTTEKEVHKFLTDAANTSAMLEMNNV